MTLHIALVTPYLPAAKNGNAHTAVRWARFLRAAGHRVTVMQHWESQPADVMIALHARRSAASIQAFAALHPDRPLIVVLTGTDLYRDIRTDTTAQHSLALAHHLVVLQEQGLLELDAPLRKKCRVIYQSSPALKPYRKAIRHFDICVAAHLRDEKDPLCAAQASTLLPATSRVRILHLGEALTPEMARAAAECRTACPRWHWLGKRSHGQTRQYIARSRLLVVSSRMEGGANVICEAISAGIPVVASDVPGNIGMLGGDYLGYYPLADREALARLFERAENEPDFLAHLTAQCATRAHLFEPAREASAVQNLILEATASS